MLQEAGRLLVDETLLTVEVVVVPVVPLSNAHQLPVQAAPRAAHLARIKVGWQGAADTRQLPNRGGMRHQDDVKGFNWKIERKLNLIYHCKYTQKEPVLIDHPRRPKIHF